MLAGTRTCTGASTSGCCYLVPRLRCGRSFAGARHRARALEREEAELKHRSGEHYDLVLSSGFLAFANHSGFLQAVEEAGLKVGGVMGTSAGALAGSLYCAGYSPHEVAAQLSRDPPIMMLRPSLTPWRGGVLSLEGVVERLRDLLPPRFEDLQREFAVGVVTAEGQHRLIDSGPLPEAVAASAAIPFIFQSVDIPGHNGRNPYKDGGVVDRIGLRAWRDRRRAQALLAAGRSNGASSSGLYTPPALVHVISRSSPFSGFDDVERVGESNVVVVHSPKAGANFFSLGDFESHMRASTRRTRPVLVEALSRRSSSSSSSSVPGGATGVATAARSDQRSPERNKRFVSRV